MQILTSLVISEVNALFPNHRHSKHPKTQFSGQTLPPAPTPDRWGRAPEWIRDNHSPNETHLHKVPEAMSGPSYELKNIGSRSYLLLLSRTQNILSKPSDIHMNHRHSMCTSSSPAGIQPPPEKKHPKSSFCLIARQL